MSTREQVRQQAFKDALAWAQAPFGDFVWQIAVQGHKKRGEERIGFALGVLNALETQGWRENE